MILDNLVNFDIKTIYEVKLPCHSPGHIPKKEDILFFQPELVFLTVSLERMQRNGLTGLVTCVKAIHRRGFNNPYFCIPNRV